MDGPDAPAVLLLLNLGLEPRPVSRWDTPRVPHQQVTDPNRAPTRSEEMEMADTARTTNTVIPEQEGLMKAPAPGDHQ